MQDMVTIEQGRSPAGQLVKSLKILKEITLDFFKQIAFDKKLQQAIGPLRWLTHIRHQMKDGLMKVRGFVAKVSRADHGH